MQGADAYNLIRNLQRQLHMQRTALDAAHAMGRRTEMKLRRATEALMNSQELERKRIAGDLHDSIGQSLNALSFGLGGALDLCKRGESAKTDALLQKLQQQLKDTIEEVRRIGRDLRPAILDDLGIVGTMSWFCREFSALHPAINLMVKVDIEESDIAINLRTPLYRVLQEATNNVVKYAKASEVRVVLVRGHDDIVLEIRDNGVGFSNTDLTPSYDDSSRMGTGLSGMRDRVEFSGGQYQVRSAPGRGTLVRARWPMQIEDDDFEITARGALD
jgi:signal transduction histidine kinase